jgi:hypothetical protein
MAKRRAVDEALEIFRVLHELESRLETLERGLDQADRGLARRRDDTAESLRASAASLRAEKTSLETAVSGLRGLQRDLFTMTGTPDAPTEADRINLIRAGEAVDRITTRFNALLIQEIHPFRTALAAAGLGSFSEMRSVLRRRQESGPAGGVPELSMPSEDGGLGRERPE